MERYELPGGWRWVTLGEIRLDRSKSITPADTPDQLFELYSVPQFPSGQPEILAGRGIGSSKRTVEEGTVLLCRINPRINRVWVVGSHSPWRKIASTEWIPFFKNDSVVPEYLCYYMQQNHFRNFLAMNVSGVGGSLMRTKASSLEAYPLPLPLVPEQRRIVARLEALLAESRAAREALAQVPAQMQRFRQAVLARAFRGELVPQDPNDEPAGVLLERIRAERRRRWEEEQRARGRMPELLDYREPEPPDTARLPELPEGWVWTNYESLISLLTSGSRAWKKHLGRGTGIFILIQNLRDGRLDLDAPVLVDAPAGAEADRTRVQSGDILISIVGNTGTTCLVREVDEAYVSQSVALTRPVALLDGKYLELYFSSAEWGQRFFKEREYGIGRGHLLLSHIRETPVAIAPLPEQRRIVGRVNALFAQADAIETAAAAALRRLERLDQAVLAGAFRGEL